MMNPAARPTKVDRASDVTGLVDTGELGTLFTELRRRDRGARVDDAPGARQDRPRQTEARQRGRRRALRELVKCGYVKSTYLADRFRSPAALNPDLDADIVGPPPGIFTQAEYDADGEFRKTAAVMKMVINGYAGAGTVTMGGYDYHGQGRNTGETRNFRAGRCIGACLEYARAHEQAADDLRLQRRLAVGQRHGQQHRRGSRQARLGQRQPVHRCVVRAGLPAAAAASAFRNRRAQADRLDERRWRGGHHLEPGGATRSTCWSRP